MANQHVKKWRSRDIIDLEYFFHLDAVSRSAEDQQYLHERDRTIFLNDIWPLLREGQTPDRQFSIRAWLDRRREQETAGDAVLPGEGFESLYGSFRMLFILAGIVSGAGAGLSFLTYTGARPLNVFVYLFVFVFSQMLLLLLLLVFSLYRLRKDPFPSSSPLYRMIGRLLLRSVLWVRNRISEKLGAERRSRTESVLGIIMSKGRTYGILFILPIFILTQLFAVGFNLGLLATTLFKVVTSDIAFGWQSTLQLGPAAVHNMVQKIALPWSWFVTGDLAYPSLARIEGSRIILKEGIYHLGTPDLVSWWPFLCLCLLFYGLLPRLFLFLAAAAAQRHHLATLDFRQSACEQLLLRMTAPLVSTRGRTVEAAPPAPYAAAAEPASKKPTPESGVRRNLLVMIPDDIFDACRREEIDSAVHHRFGSVVTQVLRINKDRETDAKILADLENSGRTVEIDILLVQEAWQPPIAEYLNFIKNLRRALGPGPCIRLGLIGKPRADTVFTPVQDENREIWSRKIAALGDPCISAKGLVNHAS